MPSFSLDGARPCGKGHHRPAGSVTDRDLATAIRRYKRGTASRYTALVPDELPSRLPPGPYLVSPKVDGEQWCLVFEDGDVFLANPAGRVLSGDIPVLEEARAVMDRVSGTTVIAGELFAARKEGRSRHGDLASALSGDEKAQIDRVGFMAFDLVRGGIADATMPLGSYKERFDVLERILGDGKRLHPVKTETTETHEGIAELFETWAAGGKAEGIVVRTPSQHTFKVKASVTLDAVVIGYTERTEDPTQMSSVLLGLFRPDGTVQVIGHCGNLGSDDDRRTVGALLRGLQCPSNYSEANTRGALFQTIEPKVVVEVRISDVQADTSSGDPVQRMVLTFADGAWVARRRMPGVSILHPRLVRVRDDKEAVEADAPVRQVFERVLLPDTETDAAAAALPKSEVLRREAFTKATKGKTAVRKLLVWKTNKDALDPSFPAYVVHFTDYSPGRKDPLKRTVRLAPDEASATAIAEQMLKSEIKKGWKPA
ncbi:MAG: hypothetical protein ACE37F_35595 [Nannocystaceae bacterium]|nr:hypothetical protein [bacterium]